MRYLVILCCILVASCTTGKGSSSIPPVGGSTAAKPLAGPLPVASGTGALTLSECTRLVDRSFYNILFSKTSVPHSPLETKMIESCMAGQSFFNRGYYNCVFAAKYSNTRKCAYAAKGIDLSKRNPLIAAQRVGEAGLFEGAVKEMDAVTYRGQDPRTTISHYDVDRYLDERDNIDRSLGERPPADRDTPRQKSTSHTDANGQRYWIVREDFTELQLAKIMREDAKGSETVLCVQFGSSRRLTIDQGYCGAMIKKYFNTSLADEAIRQGRTWSPDISTPSKSAADQSQERVSEIAAQNLAIDREIPPIVRKVVETELACLRNKQSVDRVKGNATALLSDRVRITQAEQDWTVTAHNAVLLRGRSAAQREAKRWAKREIADLGGTLVMQIQSAGGDATPCKNAVDALRVAVGAY